MSGESSTEWIAEALEELRRAHRHRRLRTRESPHVSGQVQLDGQALVDFGSNDYLSIAADPRLIAAVQRAVGQCGWGSGASPLVSGYGVLHRRLEQELAAFKQTEAALLFPTGFAANVSAITALVGPGDLILSDELNHASIVDGCRLSRARIEVYPHADVAAVRRGLAHRGSGRALIVTDSLFSMDGDLAPLVELADAAEQAGAMLMVDEAHATGVLGEHGRGAAELLQVETRIAVCVGTLSKALGGLGGFVAGSANLIDWVANAGRSYMFSTAQPEAIAAAALAALSIARSEPQRRVELLARASQLREELRRLDWDIAGSVSQIIPILVGSPQRALQLSQFLWERGLFVPAIRPPAVPPDQCRLRISLCAAHTAEQVAQLCAALEEGKRAIDPA